MQLFEVLFASILYNLKTTEANCQIACEQTDGRTTDTGLTNRALVGHSFKNFTVNKPYDCHLLCFVEKCRCQAYQMKGEHSCELLDEDRFDAPDDLVEEQGYEYYGMSRKYEKTETNTACVNQPCSNRCCEDNPCSNGGTCIELCDHAKRKFNCTCAIQNYGKFCEKYFQSCKQLQLEAKNSIQSGVYSLYDPTNKTLYQTFCDFTSESGFIWTLLESFSLANKNDFTTQQFYKDYPVNQNSFTWNKFRLSWFIMNSTLSHSTHFRATCNFNSDGLVTTDYLRAKTTELNILLLKGGPCVTLEYINIRGHDCHNCSVWMTQEPNGWPLHIDSHYAADHCSFKSAKNGSIGGWGEDNFGFYLTVNPLHRCSSGNHSTTQWWFGEQ